MRAAGSPGGAGGRGGVGGRGNTETLKHPDLRLGWRSKSAVSSPSCRNQDPESRAKLTSLSMRKFCDWNSDRYRVQPGASWRRTTGSAQVSCGPRPSLRSESQLTKLGVCGPPRRTHTLHYSAKYFTVDLHSFMHSTSMTMLACPPY